MSRPSKSGEIVRQWPVASIPGPLPAELVSQATRAPEAAQTLVLDGFPSPEMARILGPNSGTTNRYRLNAVRQGLKTLVAVEVLAQGIRPVPPPVHLTLRYVVPDNRHRDADNFSIISKPCVDGLVKCGILAGDNAARLSERVEFVKEPGARRLEVVLAHAAQDQEA